MTTRDETASPAPAGTLTRRELFAGAGLAAGAFAALGGSAFTSAAQAAVKNREYFSTYVNLELDGAFAGRLLSASGGEPVIASPVYDEATRTTKSGQVAIEPLSLRFGDMSAVVFDWVGKASMNAASGRNAAVVAYSAEGKEVYRLAMQNARLTEVSFDRLDAGRAEVPRVSAQIRAGQSNHSIAGGSSYRGEFFKQSPLLSSNFRLLVQGLEVATTQARSIDSVGVRLLADGMLVPTPLRFTVPLVHAAPLFGWMNATLAGKGGPLPGELQLLSRDLGKVSASISFEQLRILRISCPLDATGDKSIQQVEVECLPAATKFNMGDLLVK
jgi:hypothetical protein